MRHGRVKKSSIKTKVLFSVLTFAISLIAGCGGGGSGTSVPLASTASASVLATSSTTATSDNSASCQSCHQNIYMDFLRTGHPYKIRTFAEFKAQASKGMSAPPTDAEIASSLNSSGYTAILADGSNLSAQAGYVVGGYRWKVRFISPTGYIYTKSTGTAKMQYNFWNGTWSSYSSDPTVAGTPNKPYNYACFRCHTTGATAGTDYSKSWKDAAGTGGTFSSGGIQCEACHGPGSRHANFREAIANTELTSKGLSLHSPLLCGKCHYRNNPGGCDEEPNSAPLANYDAALRPTGLRSDSKSYSDNTTACAALNGVTAWDTDVIIAGGGNIKHHEQYQEFAKGPHGYATSTQTFKLNCVTCHDPHKPAAADGIRTTCESCHAKQKQDLANNGGTHRDYACTNCHMPYMVKSAINTKSLTTADNASLKMGDIRTHVVKILVSADTMFNGAGSAVNIDAGSTWAYLGLKEACQSCHSAGTNSVSGVAPTAKTLAVLRTAATIAGSNKNHKFQ